MDETTERTITLVPDYTVLAFLDIDTLVRRAEEHLRDVRYDTMVGTGLSGSVVVPILATLLGKTWMIVRKPGEAAHSSHVAEGRLGQRWIFVDDFMATGATQMRVRDRIADVADAHGFLTHFIGSYLYSVDSEKGRWQEW